MRARDVILEADHVHSREIQLKDEISELNSRISDLSSEIYAAQSRISYLYGVIASERNNTDENGNLVNPGAIASAQSEISYEESRCIRMSMEKKSAESERSAKKSELSYVESEKQHVIANLENFAEADRRNAEKANFNGKFAAAGQKLYHEVQRNYQDVQGALSMLGASSGGGLAGLTSRATRAAAPLPIPPRGNLPQMGGIGSKMNAASAAAPVLHSAAVIGAVGSMAVSAASGIISGLGRRKSNSGSPAPIEPLFQTVEPLIYKAGSAVRNAPAFASGSLGSRNKAAAQTLTAASPEHVLIRQAQHAGGLPDTIGTPDSSRTETENEHRTVQEHGGQGAAMPESIGRKPEHPDTAAASTQVIVSRDDPQRTVPASVGSIRILGRSTGGNFSRRNDISAYFKYQNKTSRERVKKVRGRTERVGTAEKYGMTFTETIFSGTMQLGADDAPMQIRRKVYQNPAIDFFAVRDDGMTNSEAIRKGLAPKVLSESGKWVTIHLHHETQQEILPFNTDDGMTHGALFELPADYHQQHDAELHDKGIVSLRQDKMQNDSFKAFEKNYWLRRLSDYVLRHNVSPVMRKKIALQKGVPFRR